MTKDKLRQFIEQSIAKSTWSDDSELHQAQKEALDRYYGRDKPVGIDGGSSARSMDCADMVEAVVAQMMPGFDFDEVAAFNAHGAGDVDQARVESLVCNVLLRDKNHGYVTTQEALRDALQIRNGILKVYTERQVDTHTRSYTNLNALELEARRQPTAPQQTVEITGGGPSAEGDGVDVTIRRTTRFDRLTIEAIDPINAVRTRNWESIDLQKCPLVGERYFATRSELLTQGVPRATVQRLNATETDTNPAASARNRDATTPVFENNGDPSQDTIEVFELYVLVDFDGDGIAERRKVRYAGGASGGEVIENQPFPRVPYAGGTGFLQPHRFDGMSLDDKLAEIEAQKTEALRLWFDNAQNVNTAELVADDTLVNLADLKARRPGGINRGDPNAVKELQISDNGPSLERLLNYNDKMRSERGGAALDLQAAELQLAGETAHGVERQYTTKEQLAQLMTRTLAQTLVRQAFLIMHDTLRRDFGGQLVVPVGDAFVSVDPSTWPYRDEVRIVAGMSAAERAEQRVALERVLAQQEKLQAAGFGSGVLVDMQTYHDTLIDWTMASGVQNARRHWIDPRSPQSIQAQQQAQQMAMMQQMEQRQLQQLLFRTQIGMTQSENETELLKAAIEYRWRYFDSTLGSIVDELKATGSEEANAQLDAAQQQGAQRAAATNRS